MVDHFAESGPGVDSDRLPGDCHGGGRVPAVRRFGREEE
jgi:hypothetical protein